MPAPAITMALSHMADIQTSVKLIVRSVVIIWLLRQTTEYIVSSQTRAKKVVNSDIAML